MPNLGPTELIIIAVVLVMLFGAKKLPDTARALGRSMRIFKSETKAMQHDDDASRPAQSPAPSAELPAPSPQDATTINGRPLSEAAETERGQKTS